MITPTQKAEIVRKLVTRIAEDDATRKDVRTLVTKIEGLIVTLSQKFNATDARAIEGEALIMEFNAEVKKLRDEGIKVRDLPLKDFTDSVTMLKSAVESFNKASKEGHSATEKLEKHTLRLEKAIKDSSSGITFTDITLLMGEFMRGIMSFFGSLVVKAIFKVSLGPEHYLTPQYMVLYDPIHRAPADLSKLGGGSGAPVNLSVSSGGSSGAIAIRGASSFGGGTLPVVTAGTRVQLPNIPCRSVTIQAHEGNGSLTNGGVVVIGGSDVIAASGTRNGYSLYASQAQVFEVANANLLWIDSVDDGAVITYIYQV